jgi:hypothetical protein
MEPDVLQELQRRGRFFYEIFPGAKASDEWLRQRDQLEQTEWTSGPLPSQPAADDSLQRGSATAGPK